LREKAGSTPDRHGRLHPRLLTGDPVDFRHTAATVLMEDPTMSWNTIENVLGHRIGSKTKRKYEHIRDATIKAAAEVLQAGYTTPVEIPAQIERAPALKPGPRRAPRLVINAEPGPVPQKTVKSAVVSSTLHYMIKF
jgi:hypothetical protein